MKHDPIMCACQGPQDDDPYCPCVMMQRNMKSSPETIAIREARFEEATNNFSELIKTFAKHNGNKDA